MPLFTVAGEPLDCCSGASGPCGRRLCYNSSKQALSPFGVVPLAWNLAIPDNKFLKGTFLWVPCRTSHHFARIFDLNSRDLSSALLRMAWPHRTRADGITFSLGLHWLHLKSRPPVGFPEGKTLPRFKQLRTWCLFHVGVSKWRMVGRYLFGRSTN